MLEINFGARHSLAIGLSFGPACVGVYHYLDIARLHRRSSQFILAEILAVIYPGGEIALGRNFPDLCPCHLVVDSENLIHDGLDTIDVAIKSAVAPEVVLIVLGQNGIVDVLAVSSKEFHAVKSRIGESASTGADTGNPFCLAKIDDSKRLQVTAIERYDVVGRLGGAFDNLMRQPAIVKSITIAVPQIQYTATSPEVVAL